MAIQSWWYKSTTAVINLEQSVFSMEPFLTTRNGSLRICLCKQNLRSRSSEQLTGRFVDLLLCLLNFILDLLHYTESSSCSLSHAKKFSAHYNSNVRSMCLQQQLMQVQPLLVQGVVPLVYLTSTYYFHCFQPNMSLSSSTHLLSCHWRSDRLTIKHLIATK